jgi:hypothetical protein
VYAFEANVWKEAEFVCYRLTLCHRYSLDSDLGKVLERCRTQRFVDKWLYDQFYLICWLRLLLVPLEGLVWLVFLSTSTLYGSRKAGSLLFWGIPF